MHFLFVDNGDDDDDDDDSKSHSSNTVRVETSVSSNGVNRVGTRDENTSSSATLATTPASTITATTTTPVVPQTPLAISPTDAASELLAPSGRNNIRLRRRAAETRTRAGTPQIQPVRQLHFDEEMPSIRQTATSSSSSESPSWDFVETVHSETTNTGSIRHLIEFLATLPQGQMSAPSASPGETTTQDRDSFNLDCEETEIM